jgi:long-chain acyl-CoA synthetase
MEPLSTTRHAAYERSTHAPTLAAMFLRATAEHEGVALSSRSADGGWADVTYAELGARVREIARGMVAIGIQQGDKVAILSDTRPEWTFVDAAAMCIGALVAPIYQTSSTEECRYVLGHSGAKAVFCEDQGQLDKVALAGAELPALEHVVAFEGSIEGSINLVDLEERGGAVTDGEIEERTEAVDEDHVATYVYTSGTTGPPKACMLTHRNCVSTMRMYEEQLALGDGARVFMFLPLAHSLARMIQMVVLDVGGTLVFWRGDPKRLLDDIRESSPTHFPSVPRVFEKIHTRALASAAEGGKVKRRLFRWALDTGAQARRMEASGTPQSALFRARYALADKLVLSQVRGLFGQDLVTALVGAAPTPREVLAFFDACGVRILEGYGMTETCAAGTLNTETELRFGTVGRPLPGVEVRVATDGEVLMRGPNVCAGYYRDDAATDEALEGGWMHTGDLGALEDGYLSITGRKKDIIVTSSGKNITPVNLENALRSTRWISEAVVYGDNRSYLVALVVLDPEEAPALAAELGVPADPVSMSTDPAVRDAVRAVVDEVNARFARIEQVKRFAILDHDLSQASGELTPTMKVKRALVYRRYEDVFRTLYEEVSPATPPGRPRATHIRQR